MGENSDIGLMKTKNKGSGEVYKMVGRTTRLTKPYVVSVIYISNKISINIGSVLHSYRQIELSCASS